jgi:hypothetical protein
MEFLSYIRSARVGIGVQTLDPELLKSLERPTKANRLAPIIERLAERTEVHLEIILGLPGDTPESFRRTFDTLRKFPCSVRVYRCLVLPDALMTRPPAGVTMDYDPVTLRMRSCTGWSVEDMEAAARYVAEFSTTGAGGSHLGWWLVPPASSTRAGEPSAIGTRARTELLTPPVEAPQPEPDIQAREGGPEAPTPPGEGGTGLGVNVPAELVAALSDRIASVGWQLQTLEPQVDAYTVAVFTPTGPLQIRVEAAATARAFYRQHNGVAVSYVSEDGSIPREELDRLQRLVEAGSLEMARVMRCYDVGSRSDLSGVPPPT